MLHTLKKNLFLFLFFFNINNIHATDNPYIFIDSNAQDMVEVLTSNSDLFESDRETYENKIKEIFEPMIDFRRVSASVMGKKYYLLATKEQRAEFIEIFKDSLLDTYAETLAQWGESTISTKLPKDDSLSKKFESFENNVEVRQILNTGTSEYPISYKLRKSDNGWKIVNIIINGVNLGLTFRNQFQALAFSHNEDIELTLKNWVSDAGDAGIS
jgi:phospholipid transport system substrate-binding protein|tara:strand:+ start:27 stop:668 length:642 start_codon:yes stop_codon:yes gene_type:complete